MAYWTKEETFRLINIWSEDNIKAQLVGVQEKSGKVSCEMTSAGYNCSFEPYHEKIKKLRAEYKKNFRDKRNETGQGGYPQWDYHDAIGNTLAHKPSTQPEAVVDTLDDSLNRGK